jgi:hypothetical protein
MLLEGRYLTLEKTAPIRILFGKRVGVFCANIRKYKFLLYFAYISPE